MSRKRFWFIAISYWILVFLLYYVFDTAVGEFLRQISFLALGFGILWFIYRLIKDSIRLFLYKREKKNE